MREEWRWDQENLVNIRSSEGRKEFVSSGRQKNQDQSPQVARGNKVRCARWWRLEKGGKKGGGGGGREMGGEVQTSVGSGGGGGTSWTLHVKKESITFFRFWKICRPSTGKDSRDRRKCISVGNTVMKFGKMENGCLGEKGFWDIGSGRFQKC